MHSVVKGKDFPFGICLRISACNKEKKVSLSISSMITEKQKNGRSEHKSGFLFLMRKPLDIFTPVSYNKVTKTAYLRRIIYTNVVMLPLGSIGNNVQVQVLSVQKHGLHSHSFYMKFQVSAVKGTACRRIKKLIYRAFCVAFLSSGHRP